MKRINTFIGSPVERFEEYLRGHGRYGDDLVRPGLWHAAIVRSPVAHGRVRAGPRQTSGKQVGGYAPCRQPKIWRVCFSYAHMNTASIEAYNDQVSLVGAGRWNV
jgi:hypothetical protein